MKPRVLSVSGAAIMALLVTLPGSAPEAAQTAAERFKPTPESLKSYRVPQWYEDAKLGIYFHWAPFSVPAYSTEWYPRWMYNPPGTNRRNMDIHEHHLRTWGPLDKFGYKDFIPLFMAEKWDPEAWVSLFKEAGAKYVVSAAVHHDGFAMWDSKWIPFNSKAMGPRRDVVGEFTAAARRAGLKTGVSTHYGRHWAYYTFRPEYDTWDPQYEGLYGHRRGDNDPPRPEDERHWQNVLTELIDNYEPDYIFVDGGTFTIKSLSSEHLVGKSGIRSIAMLGSDESIRWKETPHGLEVAFPKEKPCDYAYVLKIVRNNDLLSQAPVSQPAIGPVSDEAVPGGFVPLFSGINLDGWTVRSPENRDWQVVDGVIDCDPNTGPGDRNLWTTRSYGDFELLVDWRIKESPYINRAAKIILPNGTYKKDDSGREMLIEVPNTDSGVFLRGQHKSQVNIWCWPVGSGEVWGYRTDPAFSPEVHAGVTPKARADRPIGQWNTFHILMKGERLTVRLNGQLVLDNAQLPGIPARGPIALQHHGDRKDGEWGASLLQFRRIFIKELDGPPSQ